MIFDSIYQKGYEAGVNAQKCSDHEDQNRRLNELYRIGYDRGYEDAQCEIGEIDLPVVDDIGEALEEV